MGVSQRLYVGENKLDLASCNANDCFVEVWFV